MRVQFVQRENGPERLACEAEVVFGEGPLEGLKLVGFSIWKSPEGEHFVTFPSRAFGVASERRFFDYVREVNPDAGRGAAKRFKEWVLAEYQKHLLAVEVARGVQQTRVGE